MTAEATLCKKTLFFAGETLPANHGLDIGGGNECVVVCGFAIAFGASCRRLVCSFGVDRNYHRDFLFSR